HDSAACLLRDGEIMAAAQEERFTRKKQDPGFPKHAVEFCLKEAGISADKLSVVAFYDRPRAKFGRIIDTHVEFAPDGFGTFMKALPLWLGGKLWLEQEIRQQLKCSCPVTCFEHHESHAASAFFPSPFERAATLTIDGVGEWATTTCGVGDKNHLKIISEVRFPHSLGLLYSAFTSYLGFKVNSGEYKVMGLAPYGEPVYAGLIFDRLMDLKEDGSFALNLEYFNYCVGHTMTSPKFHALFGDAPRVSESPLTQKHMDLARSIQAVTEEVVLRMARHVRRVTGEKNLCLAGGVALNCVSNGKLLRADVFDRIWVQPAAGDSGGALGAAYLAHCHQLGGALPLKSGRDLQKGSYLGPAYRDEDIRSLLDARGWVYQAHATEAMIDAVADHMAAGKVIGWFQGRMEFGPRALGARSIIGDARSAEMQKKMNLKIKYRESFRPFAPSVLRQEVSRWFEMEGESPYMLLVTDIAKGRRRALAAGDEQVKGLEKLKLVRSEIPAVTHVDSSARVQTVDEYSLPVYYQLIQSFFKKTGCPVIVNTSFNVRGEPLVESPEQAYTCFMRTEMDVLVLGNSILLKADQPPFREVTDWRTNFQLD
ncbi:MAG: carbamoyltransferase, partial [Candidatus Omnitrophota bacterium]